MEVFRTFCFLIITTVTVVTAQGFRPTTRRNNDFFCRGEFDCKDPLECVNHKCVEGAKVCQWPGKPNFGSIHPDFPQYEIGMEVQYTCNPTYRLVGPKKSRCKDDRKWSEGRPRCVSTRCSNPGKPYRGGLEPDKPWYQLGETVIVSCKSYYQIKGAVNMQCREDGTWSKELPSCEKPDGV